MRRFRRSTATAAVVTALVAGATTLSMSTASAAPVIESVPAEKAGALAYYCGYHGAVTPPTISQGSTGNAVREAQCLLRFWGFSVGSSGVDGIFGSATRAAVVDFQRTCRISADGIVGPVTWNRLRNGC
ncbi:serine/threonine protein kinase [Streptomyces sp. TRM43335]|uniref:Serine/threonine protein kinase n=1 Tax=Streptomyces taklimakanensis TaxID=2569853 RepID=A0A6G2BGM9_9ACTN|nr:peptidoglycan-binding domain-containing protein [Streptomyces taklimakanensis]MTE21441.1 serine/threonine protein kinase [Streptomyces taklimakanensis]